MMALQPLHRDEDCRRLADATFGEGPLASVLVQMRGVTLFGSRAWMEFWRLCVPGVGGARADYLRELHEAPYAGHRGRNETLRRARQVFWPNMPTDVARFVESCARCQRVKYVRQKTAGAAKMTAVPSRPWEVVSLDFIGPFPPDVKGRDMLLVCVCHLTGMTHIRACRQTDDARDSAVAFLKMVIARHGVPKAIISDRDVKFTSVFWQSLHERMGSRLSLSTAYHPESNGATERRNAVIGEMLRCYVVARQEDWSEWLPLVELAINTSESASTGMTPFMANRGFEPSVPWIVETPAEARNDPASQLFAETLQDIWAFCRDALRRAKAKQEGYLNARRRAVSYSVGEQVLLSTKRLNLRLPGYKLAARYFGPFTVTEVVAGGNALRLDLPEHPLGFANHPVINVSNVRKYYERPERLRDSSARPPRVSSDAGADLWGIDVVLAKRRKGSTWWPGRVIPWRKPRGSRLNACPSGIAPCWTIVSVQTGLRVGTGLRRQPIRQR